MNLRSHLTTLVVATLLPMVVFGLAAAALISERERAMFERSARESATSVLLAVDAEVSGYVSALETLARSPALQEGYLARTPDPAQAESFREEAKRTFHVQRLWDAILLADREGQVLFEVPMRDSRTVLVERGSFEEVLRTREPVVGSVFEVEGVRAIAIRVPVVADGRVTHVLSARVRTRSIELLLAPQGLSNDAVVALYGADERLLAHSTAELEVAFALGALSVATAANSHEWARRPWPGGQAYMTYAGSSNWDWGVVLLVPARTVEAVGSETRMLLLVGVIAAALGALLLARWLSQRIAEPIVSMARMVQHLPTGVPALPPDAARVSEIHDVGRALIDAARAVRDRNDALLAADRAKDEFLAMLGHELRNPLGALASAAQLLEFDPSPDEHSRAARDVIGRQVRHMTRLIDDLLDAGRVTRGKVKLEPETLDLAECVRSVLGDLETSGRLAQHVVHTDLQTTWIHADGARIEQIVTNLVVNAEKYTPPGGSIRVSVASRGAHAVLTVEDSGVGVAPELLPKVFDLFVQGERSIDRSSGGLGIGLTLVKGLAELHGGGVSAESAGQGKGARFVVTLPLGRPPSRSDAEPSRALPSRIARRTRRVLVVEDNEDARVSLTAALHLRGHEVEQASDGAEGLRLARETGPDVVLIDIGLPEIDGLELARRIRRTQDDAAVRLVAMSGYSEQEMGPRARDAGFDAYLSKPLAPAALFEQIEGS